MELPVRELGENLAIQYSLPSLGTSFIAALCALWYGVSDPQGRKRLTPGKKVIKKLKEKGVELREPYGKDSRFQIHGSYRATKHKVNQLLHKVLLQIQCLTSRGDQQEAITQLLIIAMQIRNCRKKGAGKGDRYVPMRILIQLGRRVCPKSVLAVIPLMSEYGYWKDYNALLMNLSETNYKFDTEVRQAIVNHYARQLAIDLESLDSGKSHISLAGKWAPRPDSLCARLTELHKDIATNLALIHSNRLQGAEPMDYYRHSIAKLNKSLGTVEVHMCSKTSDEIDFNRVPGRALSRNKAYFNQGEVEDDPKREICKQHYTDFLADAVKGKVSAKGTAVYPNTIVEKLMAGATSSSDAMLMQAQWNDIYQNLKNQIKGLSEGDSKLSEGIVVADVSGSMTGIPMTVSIAMAILVSQLAEGAFRHKFITFSQRPHLLDISHVAENLVDCVEFVKSADWGANTNLLAVFDLILTQAKSLSLPNEALPSFLLIVSDMQFDTAVSGVQNSSSYSSWISAAIRNCSKTDQIWTTHFEILQEAFRLAGTEISGIPYDLPTLIFWNARAIGAGAPVVTSQKGAIMLSGYSPSLIERILKSDLSSMTPEIFLQNIICDPFYDKVREILQTVDEDFSWENLKKYELHQDSK